MIKYMKKLNTKIKNRLLWGLTLAIISLLTYSFISVARSNNQRIAEEAQRCQSWGHIWTGYTCQTKYDACLYKISKTYNHMNNTGIAVGNDNNSVHLEITRCLENF